jgi:virulence-associated protein VagC
MRLRKHLGKSLLLIPKDADPWDLLADSLDHFRDEFMRERSQPSQQHREGLVA